MTTIAGPGVRGYIGSECDLASEPVAVMFAVLMAGLQGSGAVVIW